MLRSPHDRPEARRRAAALRSRERRGPVGLVDYAVAQWGTQRRSRIANRAERAVVGPVDWGGTGRSGTAGGGAVTVTHRPDV